MATHLHGFARLLAFATLLIAAPGRSQAQEGELPPFVISVPAFPPQDLLAKDSKPLLAEQQVFVRRLDLYFAAWQTWAATTIGPFTPEQVQQIEDKIKREVDDHSVTFARNFRRNHVPFLADDFPYLFLLSGGPLQPRADLHPSTLEYRLVREVLTVDQSNRLIAAGLERVASRRRDFRDLMISRIDEVAAVEEARRAMLSRELGVFLSRLDVPFFSLSQGQRFPTEALYSLLSPQARNEIPMLRDGYQRVARPPLLNPPVLILQRNIAQQVTEESWLNRLDEDAANHRAKLVQRLEVIILGIEETKEITAADLERLRTAAKGTSVALIDSWRDGVETAAKPRMVVNGLGRFLTGGGSYSAPNVTDQDMTTHPLWLATVNDVLRSAKDRPRSPDRVAFRRRARAGAVLAMLDQELWLTEAQKEQLIPHIERLLPNKDIVPEDENLSLVVSMAIPLREISAEDQRRILNPSQQEVWNALADYFQVERNLNTVRLSVRGRESRMSWLLAE